MVSSNSLNSEQRTPALIKYVFFIVCVGVFGIAISPVTPLATSESSAVFSRSSVSSLRSHVQHSFRFMYSRGRGENHVGLRGTSVSTQHLPSTQMEPSLPVSSSLEDLPNTKLGSSSDRIDDADVCALPLPWLLDQPPPPDARWSRRRAYARSVATRKLLNCKQVGALPMMYHLENVITAEDAATIIQLVEPVLYKSTTTGSSVASPARTSKTHFLSRNLINHPVSRKLRRRMANLVGVPPRYIEPIQVLRYNEGEYYTLHHDGNARQATAMVWLKDVVGKDGKFGGGQTTYPRTVAFDERAVAAGTTASAATAVRRYLENPMGYSLAQMASEAASSRFDISTAGTAVMTEAAALVEARRRAADLLRDRVPPEILSLSKLQRDNVPLSIARVSNRHAAAEQDLPLSAPVNVTLQFNGADFSSASCVRDQWKQFDFEHVTVPASVTASLFATNHVGGALISGKLTHLPGPDAPAAHPAPRMNLIEGSPRSLPSLWSPLRPMQEFTVTPTALHGVLWYNIFPDVNGSRAYAARHEALPPVNNGTKWVINFFIGRMCRNWGGELCDEPSEEYDGHKGYSNLPST